MTESNVGGLHSQDRDNGAGVPDSFSNGRRGPGNGADDILGQIFESILKGPPRLGHPANPRSVSPFGIGRSPFDLDDDGPFSSRSGNALDLLGEIFGDDDLDELFGKGQVTVTAIGPDGAHVLHRGEASISDIRRLQAGEDSLGLRQMLQNMIDNPPSRNQRKLSLLSMLDEGMPLTMKLYSYAGHAGAEVARFLRDPDANKDFAFVQHLAGVLAKAKTDDKEAFANIKKRLKEYSIDLDGLIAKIQAFVDKPSVNTAKSVQMRLATAAPVALALLDDVSDDLKETRQSFEEKLRRTAKI
jgi:hypothetical protein